MTTKTRPEYILNTFACGCQIVSEFRAGLGVKTIEYCHTHDAAYAACLKINPEHPEKVAENLATMHSALRASLKHLLNDHPYNCDKLKSQIAGVLTAMEEK